MAKVIIKPGFLALVAIAMLLAVTAACGGDDATATPVATVAPTPTTAAPTAPTATTAAPTAPTATTAPTAITFPTPTATAIPQATPTRTPTPEPTVVGRYGGNPTYTDPRFPRGWDPHLSGFSSIHGSGLYNQILEYNPLKADDIIGDLAKSWQISQDGLSYTFSIHEKVKWTDGKDLTADDVAFSINRMVEEGKPRTTSKLRPYVESVEVIDRNTVKVNLKFRASAFIPFLAVEVMKVVPKHILDQGIDLSLYDNVVGSGPFKTKSITKGNSWTTEKNAGYFKEGRPFFDTMSMIVIADTGTTVAAFKAGQIDWNGGVLDIDLVQGVQDLEGYTVHWTEMNGRSHFFANTKKEPWSDPRVFHALRLATDRMDFPVTLGGGFLSVGAPWPVGSWFGHTVEELGKLPGYGGIPGSPRTKAQDIADAVALLKEAGFDPPSQLGTITFTTPSIVFFPDTAQLWAAQMKQNLGIELKLRPMDPAGFSAAFGSGDFELGNLGHAMSVLDPDDLVSLFAPGGTRNYPKWTNARWQELAGLQTQELDVSKRTAMLREMEEILLVESPYIVYWWVPQPYIVSNKVRTEAGGYVVPQTRTVMHKWEHMWFEK